ncbi:MAG: hypothetical protein H6907_18665 [Hyphomicrobiales bacterium]|nr:hypothetical protein [Hyphomicrobiales bacterium]
MPTNPFQAFLVAVILALSLAACQTAGTGKGPVTVTSMTTPDRILAGKPYEVSLTFTGPEGVSIGRVCFTWSGEGPYCFGNRSLRISGDTKEVIVHLRTNNANSYWLNGYVEYVFEGRKYISNNVERSITVN